MGNGIRSTLSPWELPLTLLDPCPRVVLDDTVLEFSVSLSPLTVTPPKAASTCVHTLVAPGCAQHCKQQVWSLDKSYAMFSHTYGAPIVYQAGTPEMPGLGPPRRVALGDTLRGEVPVDGVEAELAACGGLRRWVRRRVGGEGWGVPTWRQPPPGFGLPVGRASAPSASSDMFQVLGWSCPFTAGRRCSAKGRLTNLWVQEGLEPASVDRAAWSFAAKGSEAGYWLAGKRCSAEPHRGARAARWGVVIHGAARRPVPCVLSSKD